MRGEHKRIKGKNKKSATFVVFREEMKMKEKEITDFVFILRVQRNHLETKEGHKAPEAYQG